MIWIGVNSIKIDEVRDVIYSVGLDGKEINKKIITLKIGDLTLEGVGYLDKSFVVIDDKDFDRAYDYSKEIDDAYYGGWDDAMEHVKIYADKRIGCGAADNLVGRRYHSNVGSKNV